MLYRDVIFFSENYIKHISALCEHEAKRFNVEPGGTHTNQEALTVYVCTNLHIQSTTRLHYVLH